MRPTRLVAHAAVLAVVLILLPGCLQQRVRHLTADSLNGRNNNTAGGLAARQYVIDELKKVAGGAITGQTGDAAYIQTFPQGANVLAVIPGATRPNEYVMVGAHYDHQGSCGNSGGDTICNGATDNATGTAMVLGLADRFAQNPPDRSVIFALWDAEEDGLLGSNYYVANPVVPLAQTVAYLNLDIQGSNLLPTLANKTFAIAAETGGASLRSTVDAAYGASTLDAAQLSSVFGLYRSDYAPFVNKKVPTVFFTDSTGPCYHKPGDEYEIVDWDKLYAQFDAFEYTATALAYDDPAAPGTFVTPTWQANPLVTYQDTVALRAIIEESFPDWDRFPQAMQDSAMVHYNVLTQIVADGEAAFDSADHGPVLNAAQTAVSLLTYGDCDGFLS